MKILLISAFVIINCLLYVKSAPIFDDDFDSDFSIPDITVDCKNLGCSADATSCSKRTSTSEDRKTVNEEIRCYGATGNTLANHKTSRPNPNPGTIHNGYEFYGTYSGGDQSITIGDSGSQSNTNNDNIETFNK